MLVHVSNAMQVTVTVMRYLHSGSNAISNTLLLGSPVMVGALKILSNTYNTACGATAATELAGQILRPVAPPNVNCHDSGPPTGRLIKEGTDAADSQKLHQPLQHWAQTIGLPHS